MPRKILIDTSSENPVARLFRAQSHHKKRNMVRSATSPMIYRDFMRYSHARSNPRNRFDRHPSSLPLGKSRVTPNPSFFADFPAKTFARQPISILSNHLKSIFAGNYMETLRRSSICVSASARNHYFGVFLINNIGGPSFRSARSQ